MLKKILLSLLIAGALTIGFSGCMEEGDIPPEQDPMLQQEETY